MDNEAFNYNGNAAVPCESCCEYEPCCGSIGYLEYDSACKNPQEEMCVTAGIDYSIKAMEEISIADPYGHSITVFNIRGQKVFPKISHWWGLPHYRYNKKLRQGRHGNMPTGSRSQ
jgi:hypothetical protein